MFVCCQESGLFSEFVARIFFIDLIAAVEYLHNKGIVHRDIKQENCVLDEEGNLKLIDFGLATSFVEGEVFVEYCGSKEYAAPEIVREIPYEGPPIDIWSVGIVVFDLVIGDLPFKNVEENDYTFPFEMLKENEISTQFIELFRRILCENPENRITIVDIAKDEWRRKEANIDDFKLPEETSLVIFKRIEKERSIFLKNDMGFLKRINDYCY